jgi:hypothetical protein
MSCSNKRAAAWMALPFILDQFEEYFLYHPAAGDEFEAELARTVNDENLQAGVLIALRDDWLSRLDRFRTRISNLLGNTLRLDHLDQAAAQEAVRRPLDVYKERLGDCVDIEDELVTAVLEQVRIPEVRAVAAAAGHTGS